MSGFTQGKIAHMGSTRCTDRKGSGAAGAIVAFVDIGRALTCDYRAGFTRDRHGAVGAIKGVRGQIDAGHRQSAEEGCIH